MEKLNGKDVWVVRYHEPDFADLEGVYANRLTAIGSIMDVAIENADIWKNFRVDGMDSNPYLKPGYYEPTWYVFTFEVYDDIYPNGVLHTGVTIQKMEIE